jgi:hypothetical protein
VTCLPFSILSDHGSLDKDSPSSEHLLSSNITERVHRLSVEEVLLLGKVFLRANPIPLILGIPDVGCVGSPRSQYMEHSEMNAAEEATAKDLGALSQVIPLVDPSAVIDTAPSVWSPARGISSRIATIQLVCLPIPLIPYQAFHLCLCTSHSVFLLAHSSTCFC